MLVQNLKSVMSKQIRICHNTSLIKCHSVSAASIFLPAIDDDDDLTYCDTRVVKILQDCKTYNVTNSMTIL